MNKLFFSYWSTLVGKCRKMEGEEIINEIN